MRFIHALVAVALFSLDGAAQGRIAGLVVDARTGIGLPCLDVQIVTPADIVVARARTFAEGIFDLPAPSPGIYQLRFSTPGMLPIKTAPDSMTPATTLEAKFQLEVRPLIPIDSIVPSVLLPPTPGPRSLNTSLEPKYPRELESSLPNGTAVARFIVGEDGRVREGSIGLIEASHPAFFAAARDFLRQSRYEPVRYGGDAICVQVVQTFLFKAR